MSTADEHSHDWRTDGVRVVPGDALDTNTPQTPGMNRAAAIDHARVGAQKLWAGTVTIHAGAKTGAHHHGELESVIYVIRGKARMRWGRTSSTRRRRVPARSSSCRRTCPTRRSTRSTTSRSSACSPAAGRSRSW
ncbi:hypothetical protein ACFQV8_18170 [Pseudonocardia benzenivorans]